MKDNPPAPPKKGGWMSRMRRTSLPGDTGISLPTGFTHKVHVDFDYNWKGQDPESVFNLEEKLGSGSFGSVWKAVHKETNFTLALKIIRTGKQRREELKKEIEILKKCRHPNIVSYYGYCIKDKTIWILMDYCGVGSVLDLIETTERTLTESQVAAVLHSTLQGLAYLHSMKIVHRDVKSGNILLTDDGKIKLGDFGVSHQMNDNSNKCSTPVGSPLFMSPEAVMSLDYNTKTDIWSIGITAIEMAEGKPPRSELISVFQIMTEITENMAPHLSQADQYSTTFNDFVSQCLQKDPNNRPDSFELLMHPFIRDALPDTVALQGIVKYFQALKSLKQTEVAMDREESQKTRLRYLLGHTIREDANGQLVQTEVPAIPLARSRKSSASEGRAATPPGPEALVNAINSKLSPNKSNSGNLLKQSLIRELMKSVGTSPGASPTSPLSPTTRSNALVRPLPEILEEAERLEQQEKAQREADQKRAEQKEVQTEPESPSPPTSPDPKRRNSVEGKKVTVTRVRSQSTEETFNHFKTKIAHLELTLQETLNRQKELEEEVTEKSKLVSMLQNELAASKQKISELESQLAIKKVIPKLNLAGVTPGKKIVKIVKKSTSKESMKLPPKLASVKSSPVASPKRPSTPRGSSGSSTPVRPSTPQPPRPSSPAYTQHRRPSSGPPTFQPHRQLERKSSAPMSPKATASWKASSPAKRAAPISMTTKRS